MKTTTTTTRPATQLNVRTRLRAGILGGGSVGGIGGLGGILGVRPAGFSGTLMEGTDI